MRVNLGCGTSYLDGWVNVDAYEGVRADIYADAFEFVREHGGEVDELFMGHFLEHMLPASAVALLALMRDSLRLGATVSAVVPDMRAIFAAYDSGEITNEELNARFVYSYEQPSHHVWCHDEASLHDVFTQGGLVDVETIDPLTWEPVYWKAGPKSRWQCGVRASVPPRGAPRPEHTVREYPSMPIRSLDRPVTADEVLLHRIEQLQKELAETRAARPSAILPTSTRRPDWRALARAQARPVLESALPEGSRGRRLVRFGRLTARESRAFARHIREHWQAWGVTPRGSPSYRSWTRHHDVRRADLARQRALAAQMPEPLAVRCMIRARGDAAALQATLDVLARQSWATWTATVVGAEAPGGRRDPRVAYRTASGRSFGAEVNELVSRWPGRDLVVVLEEGDRLTPDCLFHIATTVFEDPLIDLVSWDDDVLDERGERHEPRFRPSWSPETLLGANYLGRSFAIRARRALAAGGFGDEPGTVAAAWDLLLRAGLDASRTARVSRVLAHLPGARPTITPEQSVAVIEAHLDRQGEAATVTFESGTVRVRWDDTSLPHVTVVIPTRHNRPLVERCLSSLRRTEYPSFDVIVVDNGGRTDEREEWYRASFGDLDLAVRWWDSPFNYSAVNNSAARGARGEILLFLNDDTEMPDPGWMRELVGWARRPELGVVGAALHAADGRIQHGGVVLGLNGFADHLFEGMWPGSDTPIGSTDWYRNVLAVTAACVAIRRDLFEEIGGFDERFELCGSDVVLGLDAVLAGKRNLCVPFGGVRHLESATRGHDVPPEDFFASYWRYQRWIFGGDPYFSPSLSLSSRTPVLRGPGEPTPQERISRALGRPITVFRQGSDSGEASRLADTFRVTDADAREVLAVHQANRSPFPPTTVNWFLPDIDSPFYGGYNTALRIADHLARTHGVENRFVVWSTPNEAFFRSALAAAFPALSTSPIVFHDATAASLVQVPECDVAIATLWATAYPVAQFPGARRKAYLIQDFEPMFYPAGTLYALAEESYRLGLYGICNTDHMLDIYRTRYGGRGMSFMPAVDDSVFHAEGRRFDRTVDTPATVFVYARPGHWRNCWELASVALRELKARLGDRVRIVTAGSWARPDDIGTGIRHLGLLDYRETGNLYRTCDVGLALTVSEHPSYLPLELMACGVPVVAFDNPAGHWLLRNGENSLLARRTVDGVRDALERVALDPELGRRLSARGLRDIAECHSSWEKALSPIYDFLGDPEGG